MKYLYFILFTSLMALNNYTYSQKALDFDGTDDYVDCGNGTSLDINGTSITLEAFIYVTSYTTNVWEGNVINKSGTGDTGYMLRMGNNGQVNFNIGNGSWNELNTATGAVSLNTWHHIAATYDGSKMIIYVDGINSAESNLTTTISSASRPLYLGEDPTWTGRYFPGRIDEVRVWDITRSGAEILNNINSEICSSETGLVAYYRFNEGEIGSNNSSITSILDDSGKGNHGTLYNFSKNGTSSNWVDGFGIQDCSTINTINSFESNRITIYPNPTKGFFSLDLSEIKSAFTIKVYNNTGKVISSNNFNKGNIINMEIDEPDGLYLISVITENNIVNMRLLKQK